MTCEHEFDFKTERCAHCGAPRFALENTDPVVSAWLDENHDTFISAWRTNDKDQLVDLIFDLRDRIRAEKEGASNE